MILLALGLLFVACKPTIPGDVIQPDDMEDLLYDYYVAQGIRSDYSQGEDYRLQYNHGLVFKKYGVTEAQFDSSMVKTCTRFTREYRNVSVKTLWS